MSAIFGIWHVNGQLVDKKHLEDMQAKVLQYGQDQQQIQLHQNIGFGCCINQLSRYAAVMFPVSADTRSEPLLIGDIQIYNRDELIVDHNLTNQEDISDQELLLAAYKKWGEDCPKYINGDFAFVVWEPIEKQLLVVRDHLGVRPLYYFYQQGTFAFATDYRALLVLPFVGKVFDEVKLYTLLASVYRKNTEATCFAQIKKIPPAHSVKVDGQGLHLKKYWTPGAGPKITFKTEEEYAEALYHIVEDAIGRRVGYTQAKIGAEMSGGLDSSVITVLANRILANNKDNNKLMLFSWSPSFSLCEKQEGDERELIESVCQQEELECNYHDPDKSTIVENCYKTIPVEASQSSILYSGIQEMSAKGVRFVLSGWGGDEGISHRANLFELFITGHWRYFIQEAYYATKGSPLRFFKIIIGNTALPFFRPFAFFANFKIDIPSIIKPQFEKKMKKYNGKKILYFNVNPVKNLESGAIQTRTELVAWLGANYNVQYLFPYLDYRVVDFAMSIPRHLFFKQGINRYVYRKAFAHILPPKLCYHLSKDEISLETFQQERLSKELQEIVPNRVTKELFSHYIDWDKRITILANEDIMNQPRVKRYMQRPVDICCNIQRILGEINNESSSKEG